MRRRRHWLEIGAIVVAIGVLTAWMRPRVLMPTSTPRPQPTTVNTPGLRFVGKNARGFEEYENPKDGTVLVKIPGGTFTMGSNDGGDDEKPPHSVTLGPYLMARGTVTNAQFACFVSATGHDAGSAWKKYASTYGRQAPVVFVNSMDATTYCLWAGLRLPTEEEWELAARGTAGLVYPWGNTWDASRCRNGMVLEARETGLRCGPVQVGSYPFDTSPFGVLDMAGNVSQWTSSWYERYPGNTTSNDAFGQAHRVLRGGAWCDSDETFCRGARRGRFPPHLCSGSMGFRCSRSL